MNTILSMLFQSPSVEQMPPPLRKKKNPKGLSVRVNIAPGEVSALYKKAVSSAKDEFAKAEFNYYKTYLRQMIPGHEAAYDKIVLKLKRLRVEAEYKMDNPDYKDVLMVMNLMNENKYVSKNTKRPGLIAKMFHTYYQGRDVFVKVYLYDPQCESYRQSFTENFKNEILFQSYAEQLHQYVDFISPKLYSWGKIRRYVFDKDGYPFECLYIIMEYIPFLTLKEAVYSTEHMRNIYERVQQIDTELSSHLLHHNDLHRGNIMVSFGKGRKSAGDKSPFSTVGDKSPFSAVGDKSPYPEIVILDFGEASLGPTTPLFHSGISSCSSLV